MKLREVLAELKRPCPSYHIQDVRQYRHEQINLLMLFGFPTISISMLNKIKTRLADSFTRGYYNETLSDIYATKYVIHEAYALEALLNSGKVKEK